jgi:hypothetical protein
VIGAIALIVVTACHFAMGSSPEEPEGPRFPHALHANAGVECTDCHDGAGERQDAGLPANVNACKLCHQQIDRDKPAERTVAAFVADDTPVWRTRVYEYGGEVRFDHGAHFRAGVACATCHGETLQQGGEELRLHGGKPTCLDCHANTPRGNDCSVCHTTLRKDEPPPDHALGWKRAHGARSHDMILGMGETSCAQCHTESSCLACHRVEEPESHTNFWRIRGHGLTAAIDRRDCATCHTTDECVRCHQTAEPVSHRGAWGPPGNRHCGQCHLPATPSLGCGVCHMDFAAHPLGAPLPPSTAHMTASSPGGCLVCHATLPHTNPGGDCRSCHR